MQLLSIENIPIDMGKIYEIDTIIKSTFRLISFSREHLADDLLNSYLASITNLQELLSIKNAQMEAQDEQELEEYQISLHSALEFIIEEIKNQKNFSSEKQLFQLFRIIANDAHANHPNQYRLTPVQIGSYLCPDANLLPSLVSQLFYNIGRINNPVLKAIYFHHELIRIHPFSDGNGRTTRIAKNWMLMFHLYPPIFIRDETEKKSYINALSGSFSALQRNPGKWNAHLTDFFEQEIERLFINAQQIRRSVYELASKRNN